MIMKIKRKQGVLFLNSVVSKNYPEISKILMKHHIYPQLSEKEFAILDNEDKEFLIMYFEKLFNLATLEWEISSSSKFEKNEINHCQLCGKKNLVDIFNIKNKHNNLELIIGSSCIDDYNQIMDATGKTAKELKKEKREQFNIINNEKYLSQIHKDIIMVMKKFSNINTGKYYTNSIDEKIKDAKIKHQIYLKYLKKSTLSDKQILEINVIYGTIQSVLTEADGFIKRAKNNIFGITNEIWEWCQENNPNLFYTLKERGIIDYDKINLIKEPIFFSKVIHMFEPLLEQNQIELIDIKQSSFSVKFQEQKSIIFDVDSTYFINTFKNYLTQNCAFIITLKRLQNHIKLRNKATFMKALNAICIPGFSSLFKLKFCEEGINELAFLNIKNEKLYIIPYNQFINNFIPLIIDNPIKQNKEINQIDKYILNKYTLYDIQEYEEYLYKLGFSKKNLDF